MYGGEKQQNNLHTETPPAGGYVWNGRRQVVPRRQGCDGGVGCRRVMSSSVWTEFRKDKTVISKAINYRSCWILPLF